TNSRGQGAIWIALSLYQVELFASKREGGVEPPTYSVRQPRIFGPQKTETQASTDGRCDRLKAAFRLNEELVHYETRDDEARAWITDVLACTGSNPCRAWSGHPESPIVPVLDRKPGTGCPPARLQSDTQTKALGFAATRRLCESSELWPVA